MPALAAVAAWCRDLIALPHRVAEIHTLTKELPAMSDQITETLTAVAEGLRGPLTTSIRELLADYDRRGERLAELEGTESVQTTAADNVRSAFSEVAGLFAPVSEVRVGEPLPVEPAPAEPASADPALDETASAESAPES